MGNIKLNDWSFIGTISSLSLIPVLLTIPRYLALDFATGAVIHSIYTLLIVLFMFFIFTKLFSAFENKDILDVAEAAGGKVLKIIIGVLIIAFFSLLILMTLEEFSHDIKNVLFPTASIDDIAFLLVIGMFFGALLGINGIFRTGGMLFPIIAVGIILIFFSLTNKIDITNLTPILGTGAKEIFLNGIVKLGRYNFIMIIFLLKPFINNYKRVGYISILISGVLITACLFLLFTTISYPTITENYFAMFELTRLVGFGRFFQRFESVFTLLWIFITYVYLSTALSLIFYIAKKIFNLKYSNRILPLFTMTLFALGYLIPNYNFAIVIREWSYRYIGPLIVLAIPFILLMIARLKLSGGNNVKESS